eukprot:229329_1
MGGFLATEVSSCCGGESLRPAVQRDIAAEVKTPLTTYDRDDYDTQSPYSTSVTSTEPKSVQIQVDLFKSAYEDVVDRGRMQDRRNEHVRHSQSMDTSFISKPLNIGMLTQAKSDTMVLKMRLSKDHRDRLVRKRKSTMWMRRKKKDHDLPLRIHRLWSIFTQYIMENQIEQNRACLVIPQDDDDAEDDAEDDVDVLAIVITFDQFNIILNNHEIELPPDMPPVLIWELLELNEMITPEVMQMGLEKDQSHENPLKERGFHQKQFKFIFRTKITYEMIEYLMRQLNDEVVLCAADKVCDPSHLSYKKRNLVIWHKVIQHLLRQKPFNVEDDYLHGVLQDDVLNDWTKIISIVSSLESHWKHRIQIMKYIDRLTPDEVVLSEDQFTQLLNGFCQQLKDNRSAVARVAVSLLPTVLSSLVLSVQFPSILFDKTGIIDPMYEGIFCVIKNRRLKDLAQDAKDTLMQITDICAELAADLDDDAALRCIVSTLEEHSNARIEKHSAVREGCIEGIGFVLFGIDEDVMQTIHEEKQEEEETAKDMKPSDKIQRRYLLQNEEFVASFGNIMHHGVTDKNELCRKKAFQWLQKLENYPNQNVLQDIGSNWNDMIHTKYKNFKKLEQRKSMKKQSAKKRKKIKKNKKKHNAAP